MRDKYVWRIFVAAWVSVAFAVCIAVYFTHSAWCLWAFLLPANLSLKSSNDKDERDSE